MKCEHNLSIDSFVESYDSLKSKGRLITNFLMNFNELKKALENKNCDLFISDNSLFLLISCYSFRELYYFSSSEESLELDLASLIKNNEIKYGLKVRQVTRNEIVEKKIAYIFESHGFVKKGKILRLQSGKKGISSILPILKEMVSTLPSDLKNVGYAEPGDEEKIQKLLLTEFDPVVDSVPEIDEIAENIRKQFIIVVKDENDNVIALRYFSESMGGAVCNLIYEVTDRIYRKTNVFLQIFIFFAEERKRIGKEYKKVYGWRNVHKNNLIKFSKSMDEFPDGTVISVFYKE